MAAVLVRGVELDVREEGEGTTFVWGHALLSSVEQEDEVAVFDWSGSTDLVRLVRYDARGHGRSAGTGEWRHHRWAELASDMLAVVDRVTERDAPVVLGGASMGCATALLAALRAPDRVAGLVLVIPPTAWKGRAFQRRVYSVGSAVVGTVGTRPLSLIPGRPAVGDLDRVRARIERAATRHLRGADRRHVAAALRGASASDLPSPDVLTGVTAPVLVLAWKGDPSHPVATAVALAEALPDADLRVAGSAADVTHWPQIVRAFLARTVPRCDPSPVQ